MTSTTLTGCIFPIVAAVIVALLALDCPTGAAQESPSTQAQVETRGVWIHPESQSSADPEKGRPEVREFVRRIAQANFNLILPWVRSAYVAALTDDNYRSAAPIAGWNALGELVKAAHESNVQVQVWFQKQLRSCRNQRDGWGVSRRKWPQANTAQRSRNPTLPKVKAGE